MATQIKTPSKVVLLTAPKLASWLDISRRKVATMQSAGLLPKEVRMGRSVRWRVEDIEKWIAMGCPSREQFEAAKGAA